MLAEVQQEVNVQKGAHREMVDGDETENIIIDGVMFEDLISYFKSDPQEDQRDNAVGNHDGNHSFPATAATLFGP